MIEISNRLWRPRQGTCQDTPVKVGVDHAVKRAFPILESDFPERIARAIEALEAAENKATGITT